MILISLTNSTRRTVQVLGGVFFGIGGLLSFSSYKFIALFICFGGLVLTFLATRQEQMKQSQAKQLKIHNRLHRVLMVIFIIALCLKLPGIASLAIGLVFFCYGLLGVKLGVIYLGGTILIEQGTPYARATRPIIYWGATSFFLIMGSLFLLATFWFGKWVMA